MCGPYPILGYAAPARSTCSVSKAGDRDEYERLRRLLKDLRLEQGVRQTELAERLGVPQSMVSKFETGERRLDVVELKRVAEALGMSLGEVVSRFERD